MVKLSVIIPAYNESKNLKSGALKEVSSYLRQQKYSYEVLIVDDGSTDNTRELVKKEIENYPHFKLIENPHGGKAVTVMSGLLKSTGEIGLFTDMDQATPISEVEKFFPKFESGSDIVIGSRRARTGAPVIRKITAWGFAVLRNVILGLPFKDTQCGFKAFNRSAIEAIFPMMIDNWQNMKAHSAAVNAGFDVETLFIAKKKNFKISEVSVDWHHVGSERVQIVKDAIEAVKDLLRIRLNAIRGLYDK